MAGTKDGRGSDGALNNIKRPGGDLSGRPMVRPIPQSIASNTFRPIDNDVINDVSNIGTMGPIKPDVGAGVLPGAAGADAWAGHKDAALVQLQAHDGAGGAAGDGTRYYDNTASSPEALQAHAPDAFAPSDVTGRGE